MASNFLRIYSNRLSDEAFEAEAIYNIDFPLTASRSVLLAREIGSCLVRSDNRNEAASLAQSIQSIVEIGYGTSSFFIDCDTRSLSLRVVSGALERIKRFAGSQQARSGLIVFGNLDPFVLPYEDRRQNAERVQAQAKVAKAITNLLVDGDAPNICAITTLDGDAPLFEHFAATTVIDENIRRAATPIPTSRTSAYLSTLQSLPDCVM